MKEQLLKILKGAAIAGTGAFLTISLQQLSGIEYVFTYNETTYDFTVAVVAALSVLTNVIRKTYPNLLGRIK